MSKIMKETITKYGDYYVIRTVTESQAEVEATFEIYDNDFNRLAMQLGRNYNAANTDRINEFKEAGKDVFLGKASPICIICGEVFPETVANEMAAIWERIPREKVNYYRTLLELPLERIEEFEVGGKQYYAYYDGKTIYDEDENGNAINGEIPVILDEIFNKHDKDVKREFAQAVKNNLLLAGKPAILGPHCPVKLAYDPVDKREAYIENTDQTTVGIWTVTDLDEQIKYQELLDFQKKHKNLGLNLTSTENK